MDEAKQQTKNVMDFSDYKKFQTDSRVVSVELAPK